MQLIYVLVHAVFQAFRVIQLFRIYRVCQEFRVSQDITAFQNSKHFMLSSIPGKNVHIFQVLRF